MYKPKLCHNFYNNPSYFFSFHYNIPSNIVNPSNRWSLNPAVPQAPVSIKAVVGGPNSIMVAWSLPKRTHGIITKYLLYMRAPPDREPVRRILPPQVCFQSSSYIWQKVKWKRNKNSKGRNPFISFICIKVTPKISNWLFTDILHSHICILSPFICFQNSSMIETNNLLGVCNHFSFFSVAEKTKINTRTRKE